MVDAQPQTLDRRRQDNEHFLVSSGFKTMSSDDKQIAVSKLQALLALYTDLCPDGAAEPMPDILG